jgi:hypothetical protein
MKLYNDRKLILPEDVIFELMDMTATLGEVAEEYHRKIGSDEEIEKLLEVYHRIIGKLMKLQEYESIDENGKKTVNLEELVHGAGLSFLGEH